MKVDHRECDITGMVERHIMVAVDSSENSRRAVLFVGDFFGCFEGFMVTLLHIILEPGATYFSDDKERRKWLAERRGEAEKIMEEYRQILLDAGFPENKVHVRIEARQAPSVADCIIREQNDMKCCTIVVGRRGISKKEEFIFGSTSNKIIHEAKKCAVLVIE
ncbi:MAG: universal stress protein [Desulfobulbales bacterium]|nr:universal stress protein [Desulfobulbales bacterium]